MRKKAWLVVECAAALLLLALAASPILYILVRSFFVDGQFSANNYYDVFLASPQFLARFWKSLALSAFVVVWQVLASTLAGYGFARYPLRGKGGLLYCLTVLMTLPVQVTIVANYAIFYRLGLTDTYWSLVLPAIFTPLGTLIMARGFEAIPKEVTEAAELDGCTTLGTIVHIAAPMNRSGLCYTALLSFLGAWNMVEEPIAYISSFADWPLAVALASASPGNPSVRVACCVLATLPVLLLSIWVVQGAEKQETGGGL